jgi:hypothetical protein
MPDILNKHLMIDIETMGTKTGAPVMSIGAVWFDPEGNGWVPSYKALYVKFEPTEAIEFCKEGLTADTILWWMQQNEAARSELTNKEGTVSVADGAVALSEFILSESQRADRRDVYVWGNSDTFDIGLLQNLYEKLHMATPWNYGRDMNCRTIVWQAKTVLGMERPDMIKGVAHNALDDAQHQAQYIESMCEALRDSVTATTM